MVDGFLLTIAGGALKFLAVVFLLVAICGQSGAAFALAVLCGVGGAYCSYVGRQTVKIGR